MTPDYFATALAAPSPPASSAPARPDRRWLRWVAGGLGVAVLATCAVLVLGGDTTPRLPEQLLGLATAEQDFGASPEWRDGMSGEFGDDAFAGRGYGLGRGTRPLLVNVTVVVGDATGKGDLGLFGPAEERFAGVSCSSTVTFAGTPRNGGGMVLCWRASVARTVMALSLGTPDGYLPTLASGVQQVWELQDE